MSTRAGTGLLGFSRTVGARPGVLKRTSAMTYVIVGASSSLRAANSIQLTPLKVVRIQVQVQVARIVKERNSIGM